MWRVFVVVGVVCMCAGPTRADRDWHLGLNLRSELGVHPVRIDGGVRLGELDLILVLDPMVVTDAEHDLDLMAMWRVSEQGWGVMAGWRPASIEVVGGHRFLHSLLVGAVGPLPKLGPVRTQWGIEAATLIVSHGAGISTETVSFASGRAFGDHFNLTMFVRFEYAVAF